MEMPYKDMSISQLEDRAVQDLGRYHEGMKRWVERVRDRTGRAGRFLWSEVSTRGPNIAATAYLLGGLRKMGLFDQIITDEDRREGVAWVTSLHRGNQQYDDPELLGRRSPDWPADKPWPDPSMQEGVNQYSQACLRSYGVDVAEIPPPPPPPGWPQLEDGPEKALEWIKSRPYDKNAWGACSHGMRMARRLLQWHKEGRLPLDPLIEAVRFFYSIQDPETGLWGTADQPLNVRINGTFKLFPLLREALDLPIPYSDRIIDRIVEEFERPDYDEKVSGCDEWDNWYVIALVRPFAPDHRSDLIRRLAAWRISRCLRTFGKPDGGLSFNPDGCATNWIGFDMAPALPQSDVMGPSVLGSAINVCVDFLGLQGRTAWSGVWRMHEPEPEPLLARIRARLGF